MKFCYLIFNKATGLILLGVLLLVVPAGYAQNITQSPYSVVGLGEMHFPGSTQLSGMGQTAQGYRRPFEINMMNPASYSALQQTVFEVGYLYASGMLKNSTSSREEQSASFAYFNLAVPVSVKRGIGLSFGLMPYSTVGYNLSATKLYKGSPDYYGTTHMQGSGGINRFYLGTAVRLHKNVSIGANMNYLFGKIETAQQLMFDTAYHKFNIAEERTQTIGDLTYELGAQFHKSLTEKYKLTAGITYGFQTNLSAKSSFTNRSLGWGGTTPYTQDTLVHYTNTKQTIVLPQFVRGGVAFERKGVWLVGADVNYTQWSAYRAFGIGDQLQDALSLTVGASWIPEANAPKNYLSRMEYRCGGGYNTGNVVLNGTAISSYGVSAGLGLPMGKSKSRLNLSLEYLTKGTTQNNLIQENYLRIILGITFSDQWFQRYQYD